MQVADRASVSFTLLLTVTAAKLVVADSLPKLSYLTVLDKYMMACFGVIVLVVLANITTALFFEVYPEFNPRPADLFCALALGSLWAAYNARLVWLILRRLRQIRERYGVDIHPLPFDVVREAETACADDEIQQQL